MMKKLFLIALCILWNSGVILNEAYAQIYSEPSHVTLNGTQLIVSKRLADGSLARPRPYLIKGVNWQPATRAPAEGPNPLDPNGTISDIPDTVEYGFFFHWDGREPPGYKIRQYWMRNQFYIHYKKDIELMRSMYINTIRVFIDFGNDPKVFKQILDELYNNGVMIIMTVAVSKEELETERYLEVVNLYKYHPAILMWSLGNEWNLDDNLFYYYGSVEEAAIAIRKAVGKIKSNDPDHLVSSCLGDRFYDPNPTSTIDWIVNEGCPNVDVWGINVYRGESFYDLFSQWEDITHKPVYLSEFGTDSFYTTSYTPAIDGELADDGNQAMNCDGYPDENMQAQFVLGLWEEIAEHLSCETSTQPCLGGFVFEFSDELYKAGNYDNGLGGLVDYDNPPECCSYTSQNPEGFIFEYSHPDNVANEEYFGLVDADRHPKELFWELKDYYQKLITFPAPLLLRPEEGANLKSHIVTFVWKVLEKAMKYELQISIDEDFQDIYYQNDEIPRMYYTKSLPNGKWYWRVRAFDIQDNPGAWETSHFEIKTRKRRKPPIRRDQNNLINVNSR